MTTRRSAGAAIALFTTGCSSLLEPIETTTVAALLDQLPGDVPRAARPRGVLLVQVPTCRPAYDTTRMAYSLRPHHLDVYARHEWAERPGQMLQPLLVRTLEAAGCCNAVLAAPQPGAYDFSLRTGIHELVQDFAVDPPRARVALRIVLAGRDRVVATHAIDVAEPMNAKNAAAGVEAANVAVARALREVAQKLTEALAVS